MTSSESPSITNLLTEFTLGLKYDDLDAETKKWTKDGLMDTLGVGFAGSIEPPVAMLIEANYGGITEGSSTMIGSDRLATPAIAALVGAYSAHILDYDDTQHRLAGHMSSPVLPTALVLGEKFHCSGREVLTAYALGFEVACRLGRVRDFAKLLGLRGIHSTGFLGHFGAAAAGGYLLKLTGEQMRCNFGIVAGHASGSTKNFGTMSKAQNAGNAAHNGLISALLAKQGFTGSEKIFDGERSVFGMFETESDYEEMADGLGKSFEISHNTLKQFACAGWRNPIVEAVKVLVSEHDIRPENVEKIQVDACTYVKQLPNYSDPQSGLEAKFSAEYVAAIALIDGAGGVAQFTDERASDPKVIALRRKASLVIDDSLDHFALRLHITTADGKEYSHLVPKQKGDYQNPLSQEELTVKFQSNAAVALPQANVEAITEMLHNIESVDDVANLMRLCRPAERP